MTCRLSLAHPGEGSSCTQGNKHAVHTGNTPHHTLFTKNNALCTQATHTVWCGVEWSGVVWGVVWSACGACRIETTALMKEGLGTTCGTTPHHTTPHYTHNDTCTTGASVALPSYPSGDLHVVWCGVVWCGVAGCRVMWCGAMWWCVVCGVCAAQLPHSTSSCMPATHEGGHTTMHHTTSHHTPHHITLHRTAPHHITPHQSVWMGSGVLWRPTAPSHPAYVREGLHNTNMKDSTTQT